VKPQGLMPVSVAPLFSPFALKGLTLPNRIVMAPMTRAFSPGGVPGPDIAAYYRRRAEHGVGLIITEGTVIDHPASSSNPSVPSFYGDQALAGWSHVVAAVHEAEGRIFPQLWHVGTMRKPGSEPNPEAPPVGPSGLAQPGEKIGEPLSDAEITAIIDAYARAAADARRLGFDGIELHAAHGYLIDQFFWHGTNQRTDRYGGDFLARTRFGVEVVRACRRAVGPEFPIGLRYSQWKLQDFTAKLVTTADELARWLSPLVDAGVDIFHCSTRRFWEAEFEGSPLNLAGWTKHLTGKPVITVGSVGLDNDFVAGLIERKAGHHVGLERLVRMLDAGEIDLVAVGRALLVDPEWVSKIRDGRTSELVAFTPDAAKTLY
jgi:2,4-dienoyl-CoA reductase-like NADH-dependent reductase (Old Yellow Enzyme family)